VVLAFIGMTLVVLAQPKQAGGQNNYLMGILLSLGAAFFYALMALAAKRLKGTPPAPDRLDPGNGRRADAVADGRFPRAGQCRTVGHAGDGGRNAHRDHVCVAVLARSKSCRPT
jgi:hypothetical protein